MKTQEHKHEREVAQYRQYAKRVLLHRCILKDPMEKHANSRANPRSGGSPHRPRRPRSTACTDNQQVQTGVLRTSRLEKQSRRVKSEASTVIASQDIAGIGHHQIAHRRCSRLCSQWLRSLELGLADPGSPGKTAHESRSPGSSLARHRRRLTHIHAGDRLADRP